MKKGSRQLSLEWWNELSWTDKGNLMEGEFKHRHPQSLTGREVEIIWKSEKQQKND